MVFNKVLIYFILTVSFSISVVIAASIPQINIPIESEQNYYKFTHSNELPILKKFQINETASLNLKSHLESQNLVSNERLEKISYTLMENNNTPGSGSECWSSPSFLTKIPHSADPGGYPARFDLDTKKDYHIVEKTIKKYSNGQITSIIYKSPDKKETIATDKTNFKGSGYWLDEPNIAIDTHNRPHIVYAKDGYMSTDANYLIHAVKMNKKWTKQVLKSFKDTIKSPSIAFSKNDKKHIVYIRGTLHSDTQSEDSKLIYYSPSKNEECVASYKHSWADDNTHGKEISVCDMAVTTLGQPHIVFLLMDSKTYKCTVYHVYKEGKSWKKTVIANNLNWLANPRISIDDLNNWHIIWSNKGYLKYKNQMGDKITINDGGDDIAVEKSEVGIISNYHHSSYANIYYSRNLCNCRVDLWGYVRFGIVFGHSRLVYSNTAGKITQFEGGPIKDDCIPTGVGSLYWEGPMTDDKDYTKKINIKSGKSACVCKSKFILKNKEINSKCTTYKVKGPNCNSVVYSLLKSAGLPTPNPWLLPGWGQYI